MLIFHFPSFVLKIATHSKCYRFACRTSKILSIFISAVTKPNKRKKCRHYYSKPFVFNACLFMYDIYKRCSDKPQSKGRWLSLEWRKGWGEQKESKNNFKVIVYAWLEGNSARGRTYSCAGCTRESQISHCTSEAPFALSYRNPAPRFPLPLVLWTLRTIHPVMKITF